MSIDTSVLRYLALAILVLNVDLAVSQPVDPSKLPSLSPGDISITNNIGVKFSLVVDGEGCPNRLVEVNVGESAHVRCPGTSNIRTNIVTILPDGSKLERSRLVPASAHYMIGVDHDRSFMLLDVRYRGR